LTETNYLIDQVDQVSVMVIFPVIMAVGDQAGKVS
jgi:hypothetical protein